jgi:hypothetical protein
MTRKMSVAFFQVTKGIEIPWTGQVLGHFFVRKRLKEIAFFPFLEVIL